MDGRSTGWVGRVPYCSFELGWLLIVYAQNRSMLYAGRIITGVACGIISLAVPVRHYAAVLL